MIRLGSFYNMAAAVKLDIFIPGNQSLPEQHEISQYLSTGRGIELTVFNGPMQNDNDILT
jgi:hypothetical protein